MRKTLLAFGIAIGLAAPTAIAQGQSGQGNSGAGQSVSGDATAGEQDRNPVGGTQDRVDYNELGRDAADRAKLQQDVPVDERTQFGEDQSTAAKTENEAMQDDNLLNDRAAVSPVGDKGQDADDDGVPDANDAATFGQDTSARAKSQKDAEVEARTEFGDDQSDAAKAKSDDDANEMDDDD